MTKNAAVRWAVAAACLLAMGLVSCGDGGAERGAGVRTRSPSAIPSIALDCGAAECIR